MQEKPISFLRRLRSHIVLLGDVKLFSIGRMSPARASLRSRNTPILPDETRSRDSPIRMAERLWNVLPLPLRGSRAERMTFPMRDERRGVLRGFNSPLHPILFSPSPPISLFSILQQPTLLTKLLLTLLDPRYGFCSFCWTTTFVTIGATRHYFHHLKSRFLSTLEYKDETQFFPFALSVYFSQNSGCFWPLYRLPRGCSIKPSSAELETSSNGPQKIKSEKNHRKTTLWSSSR